MAITETRAWHTVARHKLMVAVSITVLCAAIALVLTVSLVHTTPKHGTHGPATGPSVGTGYVDQARCERSRTARVCI